jgi:3-dehydroquinate dehydratase-2
MTFKIMIINGPNLNMLGIREPNIYGHESLDKLKQQCISLASSLGNIQIEFFQSNIEGEIVSCIQSAYNKCDGLIINAAAYTHYSLAIVDAIKAVGIPVIEVHISNIYAREKIRQKSLISPVSVGVISGFGLYGYELAIYAIKNHLEKVLPCNQGNLKAI